MSGLGISFLETESKIARTGPVSEPVKLAVIDWIGWIGRIVLDRIFELFKLTTIRKYLYTKYLSYWLLD